jgi:hypothetical protein
MKRLLLAVVACLGLSTAAQADLPVVDPSAIAWLAKQLDLSQAQYVTLLDTLNTARDTLNTAANTYNEVQHARAVLEFVYQALAHPTSINQVAGALRLLQNTFPQVGTVPGSITGSIAMAGSWAGVAQQFRAGNVVYLPTGPVAGDFMAVQLQKNANYVSSEQAIATQNMQALEQRAALLPTVQAQIDNSADLQASQAVGNRMLAELNYSSIHQAQATNLAVLALAQRDAAEQAQQQGQRQQLDNARQSICSTLTNLGTGAVSDSCSAAPETAIQCGPGTSPGLAGGGAGCVSDTPAPGLLSGAVSASDSPSPVTQ